MRRFLPATASRKTLCPFAINSPQGIARSWLGRSLFARLLSRSTPPTAQVYLLCFFQIQSYYIVFRYWLLGFKRSEGIVPSVLLWQLKRCVKLKIDRKSTR